MNFLTVIIAIYFFILFALFIYGSNCFLLVYLHLRKKKDISPKEISSYPMVTIQLPVYNELYVVDRLIRKVAEMNYPRDRFEIQVLDDSTD